MTELLPARLKIMVIFIAEAGADPVGRMRRPGASGHE
jgi:hypothetical protein